MSTYPYWSLSFRVRSDVEPSHLQILEAHARDEPPDRADLEPLHPVLRHYLADWRLWLTGEEGPFTGPPIRLSRDHAGRILSVELSQHDDGIDDGWGRIAFDEIDQALSDLTDDDWADWSP